MSARVKLDDGSVICVPFPDDLDLTEVGPYIVQKLIEEYGMTEADGKELLEQICDGLKDIMIKEGKEGSPRIQ